MPKPSPPSRPQTVAEHGLTPAEYQRLLGILGREPSLTELGIFSVMWSEHCSYKSSRVWLKTLPTKGPQVIQGPGENAGVVDIGDGDAVIFKMESHNHPSYIEPYQGAATGVGGIMRDVFTMGARPVANLNALRFGDPSHPKTRHLLAGVVAGIGGYGNCTGVPTVGGETNFDAGYNGNILVNAMCVGLAKTDKIFYSAAKGVGLPVVYVGSKTGRDGIHGATMASAEFDDKSDEKRPTVQVGDPFTEKLLIEACLELMATDVIVAIQDMGAAGLTSSTSEMADKGGVGIELTLDQVPQREAGMTAYEMMLSESQERMLMILKPGREAEAEAIFRKWGLDFAVIGRTTDTGRMIVTHKGEVEADLPVDKLANSAPLYERPWVPTVPPKAILPEWVPAPNAILGALKTMMGSPTSLLPALDLGAVRPHGDGRHHPAPRRRRRGGARARHEQGARHHLRRDTPLRAGRSGHGGQAGGGRELAQPHRRRRRSARHHRQHELRQPRAARDHGPVRRRHPRHEGSLRGAEIPGRVGQRLALQRDQWRGHSADAGDRRRGARAGPRPHGHARARRPRATCWWRSAAKPATSASRSIS